MLHGAGKFPRAHRMPVYGRSTERPRNTSCTPLQYRQPCNPESVLHLLRLGKGESNSSLHVNERVFEREREFHANGRSAIPGIRGLKAAHWAAHGKGAAGALGKSNLQKNAPASSNHQTPILLSRMKAL